MPHGSLRQLLNTHEVNAVRQTETPVSDTVPDSFRWPLKRQKTHKSPGTDSNGAELF